MNEFEFTLKFGLTDARIEPDAYIERLREEGCDDALIGVGQSGRIALQFNRKAENAFDAILNAIKEVKRAIPGSKLIEAAPDLVGLTDIAEILGFSRQYIRKLMLGNRASFPAPMHEGKAALWHLSSVLTWLQQENRYSIHEPLLHVAKANMQLNIAKETANLNASLQADVNSAVA
jgi:predicted DNA-binding transcriptional regulator AlpA